MQLVDAAQSSLDAFAMDGPFVVVVVVAAQMVDHLVLPGRVLVAGVPEQAVVAVAVAANAVSVAEQAAVAVAVGIVAVVDKVVAVAVDKVDAVVVVGSDNLNRRLVEYSN